jgi:hypothetical protein
VSCQVASIAARYGSASATYRRGLPKLVYLALCRSIQLLGLLARGDAAKDRELLVLGWTQGLAIAQLACCHRVGTV